MARPLATSEISINRTKDNIIKMDKKTIRYLIVIVAIISYGIYMIYCEKSHENIETNGRYTVAKVTDFKANFKNGYTVYYEYTVENKIYSEKMHVSKEYDNILNNRFFAKYNPENPNHCYVILDRKALSKFWSAPPNGWKAIPD